MTPSDHVAAVVTKALEEAMRDQIEAEMCGDLLSCQKNLLMVEAGRVAHEAVIVSEKFKRLDKENAAYKVQRRQNQIGSSVGRSVGRSRIAPASLPSYRLRPRSRSRAFDIALTEWPPSRRAKARLLRVRPNCRGRTCTRC